MITNGLTDCPTGGHFPVIICQSGSYRLSGNLTVPDASTAPITISADNVSIDLNGFSIIGPVVCSDGPPVTSCSPSLANSAHGISSSNNGISISNGTIQGMGSDAILLFGARNRIANVQAYSKGAGGIISAGSAIVTSGISNNNGGRGCQINGTVSGNIAIGNASDGIDVAFAPGTIFDKVGLQNGGIGIIGQGTLRGNTSSWNVFGIVAARPSLVTANSANGNPRGNISLSPGNESVGRPWKTTRRKPSALTLLASIVAGLVGFRLQTRLRS